MNTTSLPSTVNEHRPAGHVIPVCVSAPNLASALIIWNWSGESWVLPWSYFVKANLTGPEHCARLELVFTTCLVTLTGENLRVLLGDFAFHRVGTLRDLPEQFRPKPDKGRPFIAQIEVRASDLAPHSAKHPE
jgi:hypothetical protein